MTKTWETKKRILDLLLKGNKTLSEISKLLNLAPSTVSQHIDELLALGAIEQVDNPFIKKWKYYKANPSFNIAVIQNRPYRPYVNEYSKFIVGALALVFIVGVLYYFFRPTSTTGLSLLNPSNGSTVFSISDAPMNPTFTQIGAVNLTVSSVLVHSTTNGKWYAVLSSPKSFNLVNLRNISQLVGNTVLPAGAFDEVVLNVTNATVTAQNVTQPLFIPSRSIKIFENFNVSKNATNWINLDINLARSIRVTGSGKIILLPVMKFMYQRGAQIAIGSDQIVRVNAQGNAAVNGTFGMGVNGTVKANQSVAQNAVLNLTGNGLVVSGSAPSSSVSVAIREDRGLTLLNGVSVTQNSGMMNAGMMKMFRLNITAAQPSTAQASVSAGAPVIPMDCEFEEGIFKCEIQRGININFNNTLATKIANVVVNGSVVISTKPGRPLPPIVVPANIVTITTNVVTGVITVPPIKFPQTTIPPIQINGSGNGTITPGGGGGVSTNGTVSGRVSIGPFCPVEMFPPMPMCDGPPGTYSSRQLVFSQMVPQGTLAFPRPIGVQLNADGSYSTSLFAGRYSVTLTNCTFLGCGRTFPTNVTVKPGATTTLNINVDTGIR